MHNKAGSPTKQPAHKPRRNSNIRVYDQMESFKVYMFEYLRACVCVCWLKRDKQKMNMHMLDERESSIAPA